MHTGSEGEEIGRAEQEWNGCIARQDAKAAQRFMADDYLLVGVRSTGAAPVSREDWLQALEEMEIHQYETQPTRICVYGDSAVVSVQGSWRIDFRPAPH